LGWSESLFAPAQIVSGEGDRTMVIPESPETRVVLEKCRFFEISVLTES
jgi:hypothetical protein